MRDCYLLAYKIQVCSTKDETGQYGTVLINEFETITSMELGI